MHGLIGGVAEGADGVGLGRGFGVALEARGALADVDGDLTEVARGAGLDEEYVGGEAKAIDVLARLEVVQTVQDHVEPPDEVDVELGVLDVAVVGDDLGAGAKLEHGFARHLVSGRKETGDVSDARETGGETASSRDRTRDRGQMEVGTPANCGEGGAATHLRLGHADVSLAEEELTVQVGDVDGVEIDHLDVLEAAQREGLEQLAPDAAGANHKDYRSGRRGSGWVSVAG